MEDAYKAWLGTDSFRKCVHSMLGCPFSTNLASRFPTTHFLWCSDWSSLKLLETHNLEENWEDLQKVFVMYFSVWAVCLCVKIHFAHLKSRGIFIYQNRCTCYISGEWYESFLRPFKPFTIYLFLQADDQTLFSIFIICELETLSIFFLWMF